MTTKAPRCLHCKKKSSSYYKAVIQKGSGALIPWDKVAAERLSSNRQEQGWVCSEDCRVALMYPIVRNEMREFVEFCICRHTVTMLCDEMEKSTMLREEMEKAYERLWPKAEAELRAARINPTPIRVLRHAKEANREIYSILQDRDPCPKIFLEWAKSMSDKNDFVDLYFGLQVFTLMTNRIVAEYLRDGKLSVHKQLTHVGLAKRFRTKASAAGSTGRGNLTTQRKLQEVIKLHRKLGKPTIRQKLRKRMIDRITGRKESITSLCKDRLKLRSNGEFRHYFPSWLLQKVFPMMKVKTVIGPHLYEKSDDSHPEGAFAVLLSNLRDDHVQFNEEERRECLRVLYDDMFDRLQSYKGHAALNLRHQLTLHHLESALYKWMKYRKEQHMMESS